MELITSEVIKMIPFRGRGLNEAKEFLGDILEYIPSGMDNTIKILEIGCGYAQVLIDLSKIYRDKAELYGINRFYNNGNIDLALGVAKIKGAITNENEVIKNNIHFVYCDAGMCIPYPENFFDLVISQMCIVYIKDKINLIEEVSRVLKLDGTALLHPMFERSCLKGEYSTSLDIINKKRLIDIAEFFNSFSTIKYETKNRGNIIRIVNGIKLDLKLTFKSSIDLEIINPERTNEWFGIKSVYSFE